MPYLTLKDGETIYYKDWGNPSGSAVLFSHGWPLNSDNWENQMFFLANHGYRCIAHDRRGHGRSSQPWFGNDMDTYADDLAQLFEHLDLKDAMVVGHSTGGGEITHYMGRHGTKRVSKAVLVGAVPPQMVKTDSNPDGVPIETFDFYRSSLIKDRAQFFIDVPSGPFFNYNGDAAKTSNGQVWSWWQQGMMAGFKNVYDCVKALSETDFKEDLKSLDIPVLVLHGTGDQVVPIDVGGRATMKYLKHGKLKEYPDGAHALPQTEIDEVNNDLLEFLKS